ncbi:hypothetical protein PHAVU_011G139550 [Phaseolus vulgaris]
MRAQNQLSFSDWQNLILFTKKNLPEKFFGGGFRRPAAVSGEQWQFWRAVQFPASDGGCGRWWWSATVNGGGSNGQWCKVVVAVNGEKIRKIESCSNQGSQKKKKLQQ